MAIGILGLGSDGSSGLSSELLQSLEETETAAIIDPITASIEEVEAEIVIEEEIEAMVVELLELVETFDLFSDETGAFDDIVATTNGESVNFDAADTTSLEEGIIRVNIDQLAQKDVFQSEIISDMEETFTGTIEFKIGEEDPSTYDFTDFTYEEIVEELNYYSAITVALEEVSDAQYRMVFKSTNSGEDNKISISSDDMTSSDGTSVSFGFTNDGNHVLEAQNMLATVDGIDYDLSSNQITLSTGLYISAVSTGESSITLSRDDTTIVTSIENIAIKYNELVDLVDSNIYGDEDVAAIISDSTTLKTVMSDIKNIFFDSYGLEDEENIFIYGMSFDSDGYMEVDSDELSSMLTSNYDDLKELFVGYAEKEGIGTRLKTYLDSLDGYDGMLSAYADKLDDRVDTLEEDKEEAIEKLDDKYSTMATQFADYTVIITQMELAFDSLEAIMSSDE